MIIHDYVPRWDAEASLESPDETDRKLQISLATLKRMDAAIQSTLDQDPTIIPTQTTGETI